MQQVASYATLPFVLGIPPIVGFFAGDWLDRYFDTKPVLMYIFLVFGFIAGIRESYRILKRYKE